MDQRFIGLEITSRAGDVLTIRSPALRTVAPPGFYMLFLVNDQGVPSEAPFVHIA
jgi:hypothetical protein